MTAPRITPHAAPGRPEPNTSASLLAGLSSLAGRGYRTSEGATEAILTLIADQLGMRTTHLSRFVPASDDVLVVSSFNEAGGCDVVAGSAFELEDTY
jgi:hypothetical protein